MPRAITDRTFGLLWVMPMILIFLVGGFFQFIGLLSQTQSNWLALLLFSHVFFLRTSWRQIKYEGPLFAFLLLVVLSFFLHSNPISYTFTYFYYIACSIIAAVAGRVYASRIANLIGTKRFFKIAKCFLLVELAVVSVQNVFTEQFIRLSRAPIGYIDAIFGTFYLQSDAALAAVCELLTISTFLLPCKVRDRFIIASLSFAIIFMGNSNTARVAIILLLILLILYNLYIRLNNVRHLLSAVIALGVTLFIPIMYNSLLVVISDFSAQATNEYYHRESWETAARFSPFGEMLAKGVNFFGHGALTYYNPIAKLWLYNAGFSTVYSLYLDFGLVGIVLYYAYQVILIIKFTWNYFEFLIFLCVFILFSTFNFALTDLTFVFSFNVILRLNYLRGRASPRGVASGQHLTLGTRLPRFSNGRGGWLAEWKLPAGGRR